jgi:hypothetical protein
MLELNDRLPSDDLTEPAWQVGVQQFTPPVPAGAGQPRTAVNARD